MKAGPFEIDDSAPSVIRAADLGRRGSHGPKSGGVPQQIISACHVAVTSVMYPPNP
jgi:hypothetical protein